MKLFIYCRGHEQTIDQQERSTTDFAKTNNIIVPRIFREGPIAPGTHYWKCPKLAAAFSFAAAGIPNRAAEGILVSSLHALGSDSVVITLALYAAEWAGVAIYTPESGLEKAVKAEDSDLRREIILPAIESAIAWDRHIRSQVLTHARKQSRLKKSFNELDSSQDLTENMGYARRGDLAQRTFERGVVGWMFYQRFEDKATIPEIAVKLAEAKIPIPNPNFSASRPWAIYRGPYAWSVDTIRNVLASWKARTDLLREHYKDELPKI